MATTKLPPIPPMSEILEEDDGSRELDKRVPENRRPRFVKNKLLTKTRTFSEQERKAANAIFTPAKMPGEWPR